MTPAQHGCGPAAGLCASAAPLAAAVLLAVAGCARPLPPPGGQPDRLPPEIVSTRPEQLAVVAGYDKPVVFRFNERISERGLGPRSVVVSPQGGEVDVDHSGDEIKVSLKHGWKQGVVYRVTLLPTVRDLFGNQRQVPAEVVFSTGPAIPETAVAGLLLDRITGKPEQDAWVSARSRADSTVVYATVADTAGFYALRFLPPGAYTVMAFVDRNNNRKPDQSEAFAEDTARLPSARDTVLLPTLSLLTRDTTPARLVRADVKDSLEIDLHFDDYLDPDQPLGPVRVALFRMPDSTRVAGTPTLYFPKKFARAKAATAKAAGDTSKTGKPGVDTARAAPPGAQGPGRPPRRDTTAAAPAGQGPGGPARRDTTAADTVQLPTRDLMLVPAAPLPPRTKYVVTVDGVVNVNGLPKGGGSAPFQTPAPPRQRPAADTTKRPAADTTKQPPADTTKRPAADTTKRPAADTTKRPPAAAAKPPAADTTRLPPADTIKRPVPDTTARPARPDTSGAGPPRPPGH